MKKFLMMALMLAATTTAFKASAQMGDDEKSKRPSPPMTAKETLAGGASVTIDYGAPSLKGRVMGKDIEPKEGQVWRAGANEATTIEFSKDVKVEGKALPAGKYAFFTIKNGAEWTLIFNKEWKTWGAYDYEKKNKDKDALQVKVKEGKGAETEQLKYTIAKNGKVTLNWGTTAVSFTVK
ncbi:MAG: DUF2911 domain-containing protein [Mucilaginibacter polytrichastri]|nr:DUF2911 domain-containing protein [Mucilaginibacter polytrichastri]